MIAILMHNSCNSVEEKFSGSIMNRSFIQNCINNYLLHIHVEIQIAQVC